MKSKFLRSVLCFTLAGALAFGDTGLAVAAELGTAEEAEQQAAEEEQPGEEAEENKIPAETEAPVEEKQEEEAPEAEVPEEAETELPAEEDAAAAESQSDVVSEDNQEVVFEDDVDALGGKIVDYKTLGKVTGIGYDAENSKIYWNKVTNANKYMLSIKNNTTNEMVYIYEGYFGYLSYSFWQEGSYTVTITAQNTSDYYLYKANVPADNLYIEDYDTYLYTDTTRTKVNLYKYPVGNAAAVVITVPAEKTSETTVTTLSGVRLKELTPTLAVFELTRKPVLYSGETIYWEYSNNASFKKDNKGKFCVSTAYSDTGTNGMQKSVQLSNYLPGETCYVRARVKNDDITWTYNDADGYPNYVYGKYGTYTAAVSYKVPKAVIADINTSVTASSITLKPVMSIGSVTGFQYSRKTGSKWTDLGVQNSASYKDSGLAKNTKYQYRVRGYSYSPISKKTVWTSWSYIKATTWGASLKLKASAASSTSVKLSWNKISGAEGYEVYRMDSYSYSDSATKGTLDNSFADYTLVKTIKKGTASSFTDKKLKSEGAYYYAVRAYKTINKQKSYIESTASVVLRATGLSATVGYYTSAGKYTVTWNKMTGISGYKVEKKNNTTGKWTSVKKLKKTATSYTASRVAPGKENVTYRIRPYDKNKVHYGSYEFTVIPQLAAVKKVKASKTKDGIKVSWSAVSGADYYRVYRSTDSGLFYDKTTKTYELPYDSEDVYDAAVNTTGCDPSKGTSSYNEAGSYCDSDITTTSVVDKRVTFKDYCVDDYGRYVVTGKDAQGKNIYKTEEVVYDNAYGPDAGVKYYYYVVAFANAANGKNGQSSITSAGCTKPSAAMYTTKSAKKVSKVTLKSKKKKQVEVTIKKVSGASGYAIYRSTKKNGSYKLVGMTSKTKFTDTNLTSGKKYYYKVESYTKSESKASIYSAKTNAKLVKVK